MATRDGLELSRWNIGVRWVAVKDCEPDVGIAAVPGGSPANVTTPSSIRAVPVPLDARVIHSSSLLPGLTCLPEQLLTCAAGWGWTISSGFVSCGVSTTSAGWGCRSLVIFTWIGLFTCAAGCRSSRRTLTICCTKTYLVALNFMFLVSTH